MTADDTLDRIQRYVNLSQQHISQFANHPACAMFAWVTFTEAVQNELDLRPPVAKSHAEQRGKFAAWRKAILGE